VLNMLLVNERIAVSKVRNGSSEAARSDAERAPATRSLPLPVLTRQPVATAPGSDSSRSLPLPVLTAAGRYRSRF